MSATTATTPKRAYATPEDIYTTADIRRVHEASRLPANSYFSRANLRAFSTHVAEGIHKGPAGIYFVVSNKRGSYKGTPGDARRYVVLQFEPATGDIWEPSVKGEQPGFKGWDTKKEAKLQAEDFAQGRIERWATTEG